MNSLSTLDEVVCRNTNRRWCALSSLSGRSIFITFLRAMPKGDRDLQQGVAIKASALMKQSDEREHHAQSTYSWGRR